MNESLLQKTFNISCLESCLAKHFFWLKATNVLQCQCQPAGTLRRDRGLPRGHRLLPGLLAPAADSVNGASYHGHPNPTICQTSDSYARKSSGYPYKNMNQSLAQITHFSCFLPTFWSSTSSSSSAYGLSFSDTRSINVFDPILPFLPFPAALLLLR
jgi:hypothetical protein